MEKKSNCPVLRFVLPAAGFLSLCLPNLLRLSRSGGVFTALWILIFLVLCRRCTSRRERLVTGLVFLAGYFLRFCGTMGGSWLYAPLFLGMGLVLYGIFVLYSLLLRRLDRWYCTLAFPAVWMAVYGLATQLRCPSLIRVDMMFADMNVLLQAEELLGSTGLSAVLLWIFALLAYAVEKRKAVPAAAGVLLYAVLAAFGLARLHANVVPEDTVRVALATGPYVGDYLDYTTLPLEQNLESMRACAAEAAGQGAEILAFSEEAYELDDCEKESFLVECSRTARGAGLHMLVGLDVKDTDGSEDGQSLNEAVWIDSSGEILGSYRKNKTIPLMESDYARGDGMIPSHTIRVGEEEIKVSYLICYDSNFPGYVKGIDDDTDILFLPSWDWAAVADTHARLCRPLAVENRVSVVKPTYDGIHMAVRADGTVLGSSPTAETGYGHALVLDIPVHGDSGFRTVPAERESYVTGIFSVEILSILFGLILLYGNRFEYGEKTPRSRLYAAAVIACVIALAADAVSWIFDGCLRLEAVLYPSTMISMIMTFVLDAVFLFYVAAFVQEREPVSPRLPKIFAVLSGVVVLLILGSSGSGMLFRFENGVYEEGPLYSAYIILNLLFSLAGLWINLRLMRNMGTRERVATTSFIFIPFLAGFINIFAESFSYAYPAIMLSLAILYTMIQSERAGRLERESSEHDYRARHDALTGLPNRLAYEDRLKELAAGEGTLAVVFADLNGLKVTNDSLGHEAGDRLLVQFAELLCRHFRKEEVFRISGDEFTVLLENMEESAAQARLATFREALDEDGVPLASVGLAGGAAGDVVELVKNAESQMYREKQEFHLAHPEMVRRD